MSESIPQFGRKEAGATYIDRPGVYAVIQDERGRIAVVMAGEGLFLPGGGIQPGESADQALSRESLEECGRNARIIKTIGRADQHCTTRAGKHFTKQCSYFLAEFIPGLECQPTEPDHELLWMTPAEAIEKLALEADVWALRRAIQAG